MPSRQLYRLLRPFYLWEAIFFVGMIVTIATILVLFLFVIALLAPPICLLYPDMKYHPYSTGNHHQRQVYERYRRLGRRISFWRRVANVILKPLGLWKTYW
jgi:hypothetical protein